MFNRLFKKKKTIELTGLGFLNYDEQDILGLDLLDLKRFSDNYNIVSMLNLLTTCKNQSCQHYLLKKLQSSEMKYGTGYGTAPYEKRILGMISRQSFWFYARWEEEIGKDTFPRIQRKDDNIWNERLHLQQEIEKLKNDIDQIQKEKIIIQRECKDKQKTIDNLKQDIEDIKQTYKESVPLDDFTKNVTYDSIIHYITSRQDASTIDILKGMLEALLPKHIHEKIQTDISSKHAQITTLNNYGNYFKDNATQINNNKK